MILWTIKLFTTFRRAIAGRRYPHQLAWAVAFGLMLGIIPHGNLLAIALLIVVLSLKLNHAAAGLTAIGTSFLAGHLDPFSHQVGEAILTNPRFAETAQNAWTLPMVPWTDLNNTVVLGSFVIGMAALIPVFSITYPFFRLFRPKDPVSDEVESNEVRENESHPVAVIERGHKSVPAPKRTERPTPKVSSQTARREDFIDFHEIAGDHDAKQVEDQVAVETRIDVIRVKESAADVFGEVEHDELSSTNAPIHRVDGKHKEAQPMDEALNYLLRQLRDSQQRKAS